MIGITLHLLAHWIVSHCCVGCNRSKFDLLLTKLEWLYRNLSMRIREWMFGAFLTRMKIWSSCDGAGASCCIAEEWANSNILAERLMRYIILFSLLPVITVSHSVILNCPPVIGFTEDTYYCTGVVRTAFCILTYVCSHLRTRWYRREDTIELFFIVCVSHTNSSQLGTTTVVLCM